MPSVAWAVVHTEQYPTSCCPLAVHLLSTRILRPWGKHEGDTPRPPRPLAESPWSSSQGAGWSQVGMLRRRPTLRSLCRCCGWAPVVRQPKCQVHHRQLQKLYFNTRVEMKWNYGNERAKAVAQRGASTVLFFYSCVYFEMWGRSNTKYIQHISASGSAHCKWHRANKMLTYNFELSAGIHRSVFTLCHTLIHPRVQQIDPGYGQFTSFHVDPPLQIRSAH